MEKEIKERRGSSDGRCPREAGEARITYGEAGRPADMTAATAAIGATRWSNTLRTSAFIRLDSRDPTGCRRTTGGQWGMAQTRKIVFYAASVFVLFTIVKSPERAADLVQVGFEGISSAAQSVGTFMTELVQ
jgi:hypothetical protein